VCGAELVDLVVDLVENPSLIVSYGVVFDSFPSHFFSQAVYHFDLVEFDYSASTSATWYIVYFISLHCNLNFYIGSESRQLSMPPWFCSTMHNCTTSVVHADVAFVYLM
jgi:hypothetical protein